MNPGLRIRRRLATLAILELVNVPLQAVIWFGMAGVPPTSTNIIGFSLVAGLLIVGAGYWTIKLIQIKRSMHRFPARPQFASIRTAAKYLLAGGLLFVALRVWKEPGLGTLPGLGFVIFAILEYINYFCWQLMYDTRPDLRRLFTHGFRHSHLALDLSTREVV
ncbi:MAG: hypothetical protein GEU79_19065 [Acidimicrobiia bacterium]|nr:hypothetical protein [Acidimicrobiia bacterium]